MSAQGRIDETHRAWVAAFLDQLKADVIRSKATEEQYYQFMEPRWDQDYPTTVGGVTVAFMEWRQFVEGGRTYGS